MRLFVAADLAERVRQRIGAYAADVAGRLTAAGAIHRGGATWVADTNFHLTLRFIGEVDDETAVRVAAAVAPRLDLASFDLSFDTLGVFPPLGPPRVLWLGVGLGAANLRDLAHAVEIRLSAVGLEPDTRPFGGHLTLARFKRPPDRGLPHRLPALAPPRPFGPSRVDHVTLYQSRLGPGGPAYRVVVRSPTSDAAPGTEHHRS